MKRTRFKMMIVTLFLSFLIMGNDMQKNKYADIEYPNHLSMSALSKIEDALKREGHVTSFRAEVQKGLRVLIQEDDVNYYIHCGSRNTVIGGSGVNYSINKKTFKVKVDLTEEIAPVHKLSKGFSCPILKKNIVSAFERQKIQVREK